MWCWMAEMLSGMAGEMASACGSWPCSGQKKEAAAAFFLSACGSWPCSGQKKEAAAAFSPSQECFILNSHGTGAQGGGHTPGLLLAWHVLWPTAGVAAIAATSQPVRFFIPPRAVAALGAYTAAHPRSCETCPSALSQYLWVTIAPPPLFQRNTILAKRLNLDSRAKW